MVVKVIETKPDHSVVKRCVCQNCGVTLEYVPKDVKQHTHTDYTGSTDTDDYIKCPSCKEWVWV